MGYNVAKSLAVKSLLNQSRIVLFWPNFNESENAKKAVIRHHIVPPTKKVKRRNTRLEVLLLEFIN